MTEYIPFRLHIQRRGYIHYIDSYQYLFPPINLTVCGLGTDGSKWFEVSNPASIICGNTVKMTKHPEVNRDGFQQNEQVGAEQEGLYS